MVFIKLATNVLNWTTDNLVTISLKWFGAKYCWRSTSEVDLRSSKWRDGVTAGAAASLVLSLCQSA